MATVMQHISATIITVTLIVTIPLIIDPFKLVLEWPDTKNKINYSHCDIIFISQFKKLQFLYYINDLFFSLYLTFCNIDNAKVSKFIKLIQFIQWYHNSQEKGWGDPGEVDGETNTNTDVDTTICDAKNKINYITMI